MKRPVRTWLPVVHAFLALVFLAGCTTAGTLQKAAPFKTTNKRYAAIVVDGDSGEVLHENRADAVRFPASLTKMMTMVMVFDALDAGRLTKKTPIVFSKRAAARPPSKLGLKAGESIPVETALKALAVKSANDVAYAVAEHIGGSESAFAAKMTAKARALGMRSTVFRNASGLPDSKQVTTARDMARLGMVLRKRYRHHFHYFKHSSFTWKGKTIRGHNRVLGKLNGADGIKTGYTRASGFNLVTSMRRGNKSAIGVILGENSSKIRDKHMVQLMKRYGPK